MQQIKDHIHQQIVAHKEQVEDWFSEKSRGLFFPFYSSFDIRDSGFKIAPVDANIFPAGFNNICQVDLESAVELVERYLTDHYDGSTQNVVLLSEEHTQNPYYWDNVRTLRDLILQTGRDVRVAMPKAMEPLQVQAASGAVVEVFSAERVDGGVKAGDMTADLVISNNDFSLAYGEWIEGLKTSINPPHQLGWHQRRKDEFFTEYNDLAGEFARLIQIDPWVLQVRTERFSEFDVNSESSRELLAGKVDEVLGGLREELARQRVSDQPFVFIKNNAGTYGLGVIQASSGDDVRGWTYKARKKMKAAKGGRDIAEVIIQEGVVTSLRQEGAVAEPAIYMLGCELAGGFLRVHAEKSERESLNSPGAVFKRLCVSDLKVSVAGNPMENVYGWVARLGVLAIGREARRHEIACTRYRSCSYRTS